MSFRSLTALLALATAGAVLCDTADAASKRHKRAAKPAPMAQPTFRQEPPRMIELRPGYWISTWGCYTYEGYGRYGSCDMREGPM